MINEQEIKSKILRDIMEMMDSKMTDDLKSQSPKFGMAKVDIQSDDPKLAENLKSKLMGEGSPEEDKSESPLDELKEKMNPEMNPEMDKDESSNDDDDLERLKELYSQLK
jgi:hypothetical protein